MKKRPFLWGTALLLLVLSAVVTTAVTATLHDIDRYCYGSGCSRDEVRAALFAAYRYGQGIDAYGLEAGRPARYSRPWGRNADALAETIERQPWFDAFRKALRVFATQGMSGFLEVFHRAVMNGRSFLADKAFNELARSEHIDVKTPEGYRKAVSRYFVLLGYDRRFTVSAACFKRLLIGYFNAPAEAGGSVDSLGMDKLTHFYHARAAAGQYGTAVALACGIGVETAEFFMGHHHVRLLLKTLSDWNNFVFRWKGGWPRVYPSRDFYAANVADFMAGDITYGEWLDRASVQPFGWGDLTADWLGVLSVRFSFIDLAVFTLFSAPVALVFWTRRRSKKTVGRSEGPGEAYPSSNDVMP